MSDLEKQVVEKLADVWKSPWDGACPFVEAARDLIATIRAPRELTDEEIIEKARELAHRPGWTMDDRIDLCRWAVSESYPDFAAMEERATRAESRAKELDSFINRESFQCLHCKQYIDKSRTDHWKSCQNSEARKQVDALEARAVAAEAKVKELDSQLASFLLAADNASAVSDCLMDELKAKNTILVTRVTKAQAKIAELGAKVTDLEAQMPIPLLLHHNPDKAEELTKERDGWIRCASYWWREWYAATGKQRPISREPSVEEVCKRMDEKDAKIAELEANLSEPQLCGPSAVELIEQQLKFRNRDTTVDQDWRDFTAWLTANIRPTSEVTAEWDAEITKLKSSMEGITATCKHQGAEGMELRSRLKDKDAEIARLREQLKAPTQDHEDARKMWAATNQQQQDDIAWLRKELESQDDLATRLRAEITRLKHELECEGATCPDPEPCRLAAEKMKPLDPTPEQIIAEAVDAICHVSLLSVPKIIDAFSPLIVLAERQAAELAELRAKDERPQWFKWKTPVSGNLAQYLRVDSPGKPGVCFHASGEPGGDEIFSWVKEPIGPLDKLVKETKWRPVPGEPEAVTKWAMEHKGE